MEYKQFSELSKSDVGKKYTMRGQVEVVKQTSGPTLMILNDGSASFTFKAFIKPGVRAYPEIDVGDTVEVKAQVTERNDDIEAEVTSMTKLSGEKIKEFKKHIQEEQDKIIAPPRTNFTIKSEVLEALKPRFIKVASIIRKAIVDRRPILIRHNADCDGYSSAITIERAVLALMREISGGDANYPYYYYRRAPSKAPFYEYEDSVKDLNNILKDKIKNDMKSPLIIITDNGSTEEDLLSIKQMKIQGCDLVVVDHHFPGKITNGKVLVDEFVSAHINPYLEGYDSNVCTGMLGYELARFIYPKDLNPVLIPATSAILDHTEGPEREQYLDMAYKEGFTYEYMETLGEIIDMQSHYLRFMEAREFIDELFGTNMEFQREIVGMLGKELKKRYERVEAVAKHYSEKEDFGPFYLIHFDGEKGTYRGEYPAIGKSTNHVHKIFQKELDKPVITMTTGSTFMTVRVADEVKNISIPEFSQIVMKEKPYTHADGGGHERAGSVKFVEYGREEVLGSFREYLREVANRQ